VDIVDEVVRLCGMKLYLHGVGHSESPIKSGDALATDPANATTWFLPIRPSARESSYKVIGEDGEVDTERKTTSARTSSSPPPTSRSTSSSTS